MMQKTKIKFNDSAHKALNDSNLQKALSNIRSGFVEKRSAALEEISEFDEMRNYTQAIKEHTLDNLGFYLQQFEENVSKNGGKVHFAESENDACEAIISICKDKAAKSIIKGKSMISEEISLNEALEAEGFEIVESDLGEYIIQLRGEKPSHIIAPAVHLNKEQIEADFKDHHKTLDEGRDISQIGDLVKEARAVLRDKFIKADVGITGANFIISETGSAVIVTNEGNGDLSQILPKTHIIITSIEKVIPKLEDVSAFIRILGRAATGQDITAYTSFASASKEGEGAGDGKDFHVVLLDNGRCDINNSDMKDILSCIRCGACINHCPVYQAVGGHSYGWVYPGPMGAVLTPCFIGSENASDLYTASTFCGRCEEVCSMNIPLPQLLRNLRTKNFENKSIYSDKIILRIWSFIASKPRLYHLLMKITGFFAASFIFSKDGKFRDWLKYLVPGWLKYRDMEAMSSDNFINLYKKSKYNRKA